MTKLQTRADLEAYALSISLPLLESIPTDWEKLSVRKTDNGGYIHGYFEAYCRPLWGLAPLLKNREEPIYVRQGGRKDEIHDWYLDHLISGLDPASPRYWEKHLASYGNQVAYVNQTVTEVVALAYAFVIDREKLWDPLPASDKLRIAAWLNGLAKTKAKVTWNNNHHWFYVLIFLALKSLEMPYDKECLAAGLLKLDAFYLGNGWYRDGDFGRFDYYIPWAHQLYPLLWIMMEDPGEPGYTARKQMYLERTNAFLAYYPRFFDSTGAYVPFGRSLTYRYAAAALFPLACYVGCEIDPGLARNLTLSNIDYFRKNGAEDGQIVEPGYAYPNRQVVENYVSDAGPYWCTKAFLALLMPTDHAFWTAPAKPAPIAEQDYLFSIDVPDIHMTLAGENTHSGVTLYNNTASYVQGGFYHRFNDMHSLYAKFAYNSRSGTSMSTRDNLSVENMIGLETPDGLLCSHRARIEDFGWSGKALLSRHTPFSNDPTSTITTLILPLRGGYHLRAHRVEISQPYKVVEGGFSVGRRDDFEKIERNPEWISVRTATGYSWLHLHSTEEVALDRKDIHPGMHLLYPAASYPAWFTPEPLLPGVYCFATSFFFSDKPDQCSGHALHAESPAIAFSASQQELSVSFKDRRYALSFVPSNKQ